MISELEPDGDSDVIGAREFESCPDHTGDKIVCSSREVSAAGKFLRQGSGDS
jgi:hypothetical protein